MRELNAVQRRVVFAAFLGWSEFAVRKAISIRAIWERVNEGDEVGELLLIKTL